MKKIEIYVLVALQRRIRCPARRRHRRPRPRPRRRQRRHPPPCVQRAVLPSWPPVHVPRSESPPGPAPSLSASLAFPSPPSQPTIAPFPPSFFPPPPISLLQPHLPPFVSPIDPQGRLWRGRIIRRAQSKRPGDSVANA